MSHATCSTVWAVKKTREATQMISTGCDNCRYYKAHRCKLWQVKVPKPNDSHCESWRNLEK